MRVYEFRHVPGFGCSIVSVQATSERRNYATWIVILRFAAVLRNGENGDVKLSLAAAPTIS